MDNNFNLQVGERIFKARKEQKMTRAELGGKVGLHESTVKRYEDGQIKSLDIDKLKEFAKALDVEPEYLTGWGEHDANTPVKHKIKLLARNLEELPEQDRDKLIQNFQETIDIYLKARGITVDQEDSGE